MSLTGYPWYGLVTDALQQGDFLKDCVTPVQPIELGAPPAEQTVKAHKYDLVVVMTQSCDLADGDLSQVQVCPVWTLEKFLEALPSNEKRKARQNQLKGGRLVGYHLLNRCVVPENNRPHLVADFNRVFSIPVGYALSFASEPRIRLLPPYREHLAQGFARYYMRVGLPADIDGLS